MDSALPVTPIYPLEHTNVLEARFLELSRLEGREHLRGLQWPTSAEDPDYEQRRLFAFHDVRPASDSPSAVAVPR